MLWKLKCWVSWEVMKCQSNNVFQQKCWTHNKTHLFSSGHSGKNSYHSTQWTSLTFQEICRWYKCGKGKTKQHLPQVLLISFLTILVQICSKIEQGLFFFLIVFLQDARFFYVCSFNILSIISVQNFFSSIYILDILLWNGLSPEKLWMNWGCMFFSCFAW